jgi:hypothetical protein
MNFCNLFFLCNTSHNQVVTKGNYNDYNHDIYHF